MLICITRQFCVKTESDYACSTVCIQCLSEEYGPLLIRITKYFKVKQIPFDHFFAAKQPKKERLVRKT